MRKIILLFGPAGAGKGEQSSRLQKHGWTSISTGQLLREHAIHNVETQHILNAGALVSDDLILKLTRDHLDTIASENIILDGFPRTLEQMKAMNDLKIFPNNIFIFVIPDDTVIERLSGRLIHLASGRVYHTLYNPPLKKDTDDLTGEALISRADDQAVVIKSRLNLYNKTVKKMIDLYLIQQETRNIKITFLNATESMDNIFQACLTAL